MSQKTHCDACGTIVDSPTWIVSVDIIAVTTHTSTDSSFNRKDACSWPCVRKLLHAAADTLGKERT